MFEEPAGSRIRGDPSDSHSDHGEKRLARGAKPLRHDRVEVERRAKNETGNHHAVKHLYEVDDKKVVDKTAQCPAHSSCENAEHQQTSGSDTLKSCARKDDQRDLYG